MTICLYGYLYAWLSVCMAICMHGYLSVWLPVCMAICLHGYLSVWLSVCMAICMHGYLSVWLSFWDQSICVSEEEQNTKTLLKKLETLPVFELTVYRYTVSL